MRGVAVICVTACGRIGFDSAPPADAPADTAAIDWTAWSEPVRLSLLATDLFDWEPAIHPDNKTLVFTRFDGGSLESDLFLSELSGGEFGPPTKLAFSLGSDSGAVWTSGGTQLYFSSYRTGFPRLYLVDFDGNTFGTPAIVPELANESLIGATLSADGLELLYNDDSLTDAKIRRATRTSLTSPWQVQGVVAELDSAVVDGWPSLAPDGLSVLFESARDNEDGFIYIATRPSPAAPFANIAKVAALSDGRASGDPDISADGLTVFFGADRSDSAGGQDLYVATRQ